MNAPTTRGGLLSAFAIALCLTAAGGCGSQNIPLAEVPPDATEKVLKAQVEPAKPQRLPPKNQMSQGRPY